jgi:hypothetical protein
LLRARRRRKRTGEPFPYGRVEQIEHGSIINAEWSMRNAQWLVNAQCSMANAQWPMERPAIGPARLA